MDATVVKQIRQDENYVLEAVYDEKNTIIDLYLTSKPTISKGGAVLHRIERVCGTYVTTFPEDFVFKTEDQCKAVSHAWMMRLQQKPAYNVTMQNERYKLRSRINGDEISYLFDLNLQTEVGCVTKRGELYLAHLLDETCTELGTFDQFEAAEWFLWDHFNPIPAYVKKEIKQQLGDWDQNPLEPAPIVFPVAGLYDATQFYKNAVALPWALTAGIDLGTRKPECYLHGRGKQLLEEFARESNEDLVLIRQVGKHQHILMCKALIIDYASTLHGSVYQAVIAEVA